MSGLFSLFLGAFCSVWEDVLFTFGPTQTLPSFQEPANGIQSNVIQGNRSLTIVVFCPVEIDLDKRDLCVRVNVLPPHVTQFSEAHARIGHND